MASSNVRYKAKDGTLINLTTKVINNTTSTSTTDALSAAQGKVLNDEKAASKVLSNDADLNTVKTPGMYSCGGGNSIKNKPTGLDAIGLIVIHNASGEYYTQILTTSTNTNTYRRSCVNGTWNAWTIDKYTDTTYTKASLGLGNVDNTADANKTVKAAGTATKLGSSTVGSAATPIYLNNGAAAVCTGIMKAPQYSTTDLTPGVSALADGQIYIVYYN